MLNADFKAFAESFNACGIDYLVVGGYALAAYGHPRCTGDIDFWIRPSPENIRRVLLALERCGFDALGLAAADFAADSVVRLDHPPRRIDLLMGQDGVDFDGCWARRQTLQVDGVPLQCIGLEDFKLNKRATGRLKDLADLRALEGPAPA